MDVSSGGSSGFGDNQDNNRNLNKGESSYHFTSDEEAQLEAHGTVNTNVNRNTISDIEESTKMKEKTQMLKVATAAMEELLRLMNTNEPLWTKSLNDEEGFILVPERYVNMFPNVINLASPDTHHEECSKHSQIVRISGMPLVEKILDSEEWAKLFPTIVSEAETVEVFDVGSLANRSGALQLMYEEVHVLSPLVPSREFFFLRYCEQIDVGTWVIVDVSLDSFGEYNPHSPARRLPSGCMIREMPNGSSMVTWIEHVIVNDTIQRTRQYRDLIRNNVAYGARRWLLALQRMCEKNFCSSIDYTPRRVAGREIKSHEGRKSVINLSNRMVQNFCKILNMSDMPSFARNAEECDLNQMNTIIHKGLPNRMVITGVMSLWLPLPPQNVFHFLNNENRRREWDVFSCGNPVRQLAHIPIGGTNAYNRISIFQTFNGRDNDVLFLQESCIDPLAAYVVFAPISVRHAHMTLNGEDSSSVSVIPSGFMVSGDGRAINYAEASGSGGNATRSEGSMLTMAYQMLFQDRETRRGDSRENELSFNRFFLSTIQKIMASLDCSIQPIRD